MEVGRRFAWPIVANVFDTPNRFRRRYINFKENSPPKKNEIAQYTRIFLRIQRPRMVEEIGRAGVDLVEDLEDRGTQLGRHMDGLAEAEPDPPFFDWGEVLEASENKRVKQ